jgi:hypothetical protein
MVDLDQHLARACGWFTAAVMPSTGGVRNGRFFFRAHMGRTGINFPDALYCETGQSSVCCEVVVAACWASPIACCSVVQS